MSEGAFLRVALVQINTTVGDLPGNRELVEEAYRQAALAGASIIVFPELTLTGYPPEDLLLKPAFLKDTRACLDALAPHITRGIAIVGWVEASPEGPRNAAAVIARGRVRDIYRKCTLPNYGVFDEKRYFAPAARCPVYDAGPWRIAVNICEDVWARGGVPALQARAGKANLMLNLSASPYHARKGRVREHLIRFRARELGLPIAQANLVGGQDELVFDGQSLIADAAGRLVARAPQFLPHVLLTDVPLPDRQTARAATPVTDEEPAGAVPPPAPRP